MSCTYNLFCSDLLQDMPFVDTNAIVLFVVQASQYTICISSWH